jgi:hypothetical protein
VIDCIKNETENELIGFSKYRGRADRLSNRSAIPTSLQG